LNENVLGESEFIRAIPNKMFFLMARRVSTTDKPGISTIDWQFRDPWGNPYIIHP